MDRPRALNTRLGRRRSRRVALAAVLVAGALAACSNAGKDDTIELRLWALGREGEVVQQLIPEFERRNPGIRVRVQQVPWSAAHEKLLTAYVGESTPDVSQRSEEHTSELQSRLHLVCRL